MHVRANALRLLMYRDAVLKSPYENILNVSLRTAFECAEHTMYQNGIAHLQECMQRLSTILGEDSSSLFQEAVVYSGIYWTFKMSQNFHLSTMLVLFQRLRYD